MTKKVIDLDVLYDDFYQCMVRIAASKKEFVDVLGAEDALQEAGLGWVLGVYAWVNSERKAQGAGRKVPMLSVKGEALSAKQGLMPNAYGLRPDDEELVKAGTCDEPNKKTVYAVRVGDEATMKKNCLYKFSCKSLAACDWG